MRYSTECVNLIAVKRFQQKTGPVMQTEIVDLSFTFATSELSLNNCFSSPNLLNNNSASFH